MWTCEHHLKCQNNHQHDCGHPRKEEEKEEEEEEGTNKQSKTEQAVKNEKNALTKRRQVTDVVYRENKTIIGARIIDTLIMGP